MQNISHTVPFGENMCSIYGRREYAKQKAEKEGKEIKRAEISWLEFCSFISFFCVFFLVLCGAQSDPFASGGKLAFSANFQAL